MADICLTEAQCNERREQLGIGGAYYRVGKYAPLYGWAIVFSPISTVVHHYLITNETCSLFIRGKMFPKKRQSILGKGRESHREGGVPPRRRKGAHLLSFRPCLGRDAVRRRQNRYLLCWACAFGGPIRSADCPVDGGTEAAGER